MATYIKRAMVTLKPEWEEPLKQLKKEKFHDVSYAEMYRTLIDMGLKAAQEDPASVPAEHRQSKNT